MGDMRNAYKIFVRKPERKRIQVGKFWNGSYRNRAGSCGLASDSG
jgi:hypothetical protein